MLGAVVLVEVKQRLTSDGLRGFDERTAAEGGAAENGNPDDAALDNSDAGVPLTWPCICHAQLGRPCGGPNSILFSVAFSCQKVKKENNVGLNESGSVGKLAWMLIQCIKETLMPSLSQFEVL